MGSISLNSYWFSVDRGLKFGQQSNSSDGGTFLPLTRSSVKYSDPRPFLLSRKSQESRDQLRPQRNDRSNGAGGPQGRGRSIGSRDDFNRAGSLLDNLLTSSSL